MDPMISKSPDRRRVSFVVLGLLLVAVLAVPSLGALYAAAVAGCQPVAPSSIAESDSFTPYDRRLTHTPERAINPNLRASAAAVAFVPSTLDALPISWVAQPLDRLTATYYLDKPIDRTMTRPEFFAAGGLLITTAPDDPDAGPYALGIQAQLGDRATIVKVGQVDGVLTWGDPISNGIRPHQLSWASDGLVHSIIADRPADRMLALAREVAC